MRRVDATLVAGDGISDDTARKAFHRLTLQPFGEVDIDPATGEATYEWHEAIWDLIDRRIPADVRTAMRDHAVVAAHREGNAAAEPGDTARAGQVGGGRCGRVRALQAPGRTRARGPGPGTRDVLA
ncbi:hypothetical protein GCM10025876_07400 [Demequina litorisediminis]|uniref:Uncharacterized protein n=2 Tax=Demequina litorisediminis TaxID=1849022 RepID=A0ABQ6IAP4_9MICO|nr:hypothetical protein GCM10025876_07400 [Demequina litorisediminis]